MKTQEKDIYHGIALTQIIEHNSFKALNRLLAKYGHYSINTDRRVFVKYRTNCESPWQFTFQRQEVTTIQETLNAGHKIFLCLVCGQITVCALNQEEISLLLDFANRESQWIRVEVPTGGSCHVAGTKGKLKKAITHNSFPEKVFA